MAKLLENVVRSVDIALVNELAIRGQRMGMDIRKGFEADSTKPCGFICFVARGRECAGAAYRSTPISLTGAVVLVVNQYRIDHPVTAERASLLVDLRGITHRGQAENLIRL